MSDKRQLIPITGLVVTMAIATYLVVQIAGQGTSGDGQFHKRGSC